MLDAVVADPAGTLLALDFDGTLAHVVDDPSTAYAHSHAVDALARGLPRGVPVESEYLTLCGHDSSRT